MRNGNKRYDMIIIGSGLAGLTSAALLTQAGYRVLVLEQHYIVGGCAHTFKRHNYIFDTAIHLIGGAEPGGEVYNLYERLGLLGKIKFRKIDPMITLRIEDKSYPIPSQLNKLSSQMEAWFPEEAVAIREVIDEIKYIGGLKGSYNLKELKRILQFEKMTYQEYLEKFFQHPHIMMILSSLVLFAGVPINQLSTFKMMNIMASYDGGAYYPKGNSQQLSNILKEYILFHGGEIKLNRRVEKIIFDETEIKGVIDQRGNSYLTTTVISNADMKSTLTKMIDSSLIPKSYMKRIEKLEISLSAVVLYGVIKNEVFPEDIYAHETVFFTQDNIINEDQLCFDPFNPKNDPVISICCPSLTEDSLAPEGYSIINMMSLCDPSYIEKIRDEKGKEFIFEQFIKVIEKKLPGIRENLEFYEFATPRTISRYTFNEQGAIYGWRKSVNKFGINEIGGSTPINGLYVAGHWTQGVHGVYGVIRSGRLAVQQVIEDALKKENKAVRRGIVDLK